MPNHRLTLDVDEQGLTFTGSAEETTDPASPVTDATQTWASDLDYDPAAIILTGTITDPAGTVYEVSGWEQPGPVVVSETDLMVPMGSVYELDPARDTELTLNGRTVVMGTFRSRPNPGVTHTITLVCDEASYVGGDAGMSTDPGLHVMQGGILDLAGTARTRWTRLVNDELAGVSSFDVSDATGWQVGDAVAVTPTVTRDYTGADYWDAYDYGTITAIAGNTVTVGVPFVHPHPERFVNGTRYTAEVLNLSSNLLIWSDAGTRGHIVFHAGAVPQTLSHFTLHGLGIEDITGRYPLHWHRAGPSAAGTTVTGVLITSSQHRGFVPHETEGITFSECVAHDCLPLPFWWDSGDESNGITYDRCIASRIHNFTTGSTVNRTMTAAAFDASRTTTSAMSGCVAVGIRNVDKNNKAAGGLIWASQNNHQPSGWAFSDTLIHNCRGEAMATWQNTGTNVDVPDVDAYSCARFIDHGAYTNPYHYTASHAADMAAGINLHAKGTGRGARFADITVGNPAGTWAFNTPANVPLPAAAPVEIVNVTSGGHGIRANGNTDPDLLTVSGFTVPGDRYLFSSTAHPDTLVTDTDIGAELRPVTYTGDTSGMTWRADWNCWELHL